MSEEFSNDSIVDLIECKLHKEEDRSRLYGFHRNFIRDTLQNFSDGDLYEPVEEDAYWEWVFELKEPFAQASRINEAKSWMALLEKQEPSIPIPQGLPLVQLKELEGE